MPASVYLADQKISAAGASDAEWLRLRQLGRLRQLSVRCCGGWAVPVERDSDGGAVRFFRHGPGQKVQCERKTLSDAYERMVARIEAVAHGLDWITDTDARHGEIFLDVLCTRERSPTKVAVEVDLSFSGLRDRRKVEHEWRRISREANAVLAIVRGWKAIAPPRVTVAVLPVSTDNTSALDTAVAKFLRGVERSYRFSVDLERWFGERFRPEHRAPASVIANRFFLTAGVKDDCGLACELENGDLHVIAVKGPDNSLVDLSANLTSICERHEIRVCWYGGRTRLEGRATQTRVVHSPVSAPQHQPRHRSSDPFGNIVHEGQLKRAWARLRKFDPSFDGDEKRSWLGGKSLNEYDNGNYDLEARVETFLDGDRVERDA